MLYCGKLVGDKKQWDQYENAYFSQNNRLSEHTITLHVQDFIELVQLKTKEQKNWIVPVVLKYILIWFV